VDGKKKYGGRRSGGMQGVEPEPTREMKAVVRKMRKREVLDVRMGRALGGDTSGQEKKNEEMIERKKEAKSQVEVQKKSN